MVLRLAYLDTETGGLDPKVCGLTEIGAYAFDLDTATWRVNERAVYQTYVRPVDGLVYDPQALAIQSTPERPITLDYLREQGVEEQAAIVDLIRFLQDHLGLHFGGWGPKIWTQFADFDHGFIRAALVRTQPEPNHSVLSPRCDWACSRKLFTTLGSLGMHDRINPSMRYIREHYGIPDVGTHTALGDAKAGVQAVRAMLRDLSSVPW